MQNFPTYLLTMQKTRMGLAAGSYHVNADGSDITGVVYPVKVKKSELTGLKEVTDATSVSDCPSGTLPSICSKRCQTAKSCRALL